MKKLVLFTAAAGLGLVGATPPAHWAASNESGSGRASQGYPPCSRTVTDRCIQLYERGVATRANLALNERLGVGRTGIAMGGPEPDGGWTAPSRDDYPPCSRTVTDRCIQLYERGVRGR